MHILWVEDNARFVRVAGPAFLYMHELVVAPSLVVARQCLADRKFDAVLLDYDLPDGKGIELLVTLDALPLRPIIVGTSSHAFGNSKLVEAGADVVCMKKEFGQIEAKLKETLFEQRLKRQVQPDDPSCET